MKKININSFVALMAVFVLFASINDAHSRRFGGGKSFGSKPSFSNPFRRSASRAKSPSQRQAATHNQAARTAMSRRGGLMGMLGGLALGGLLGSMLFGGAFENLNLFDLLTFGLIAFVLYKIFASRNPRPAYQSDSMGGHDSFHSGQQNFTRHGGYDLEPGRDGDRRFETDLLSSKDKHTPINSDRFAEDAEFSEHSVPEGFDEGQFLSGAKAAYTQLQAAWDNGELTEIRGLTTDKVFAEIQQQLREQDGSNRTDILKLDVECLGVREVGTDLEASVMFDAIMRESERDRPEQIREIWHFIRPINSRTPTWLLDGIQQLAD